MGMGGGEESRGLTGIEKFEATLPVRTAIACSNWARATPRFVAVACAFCKVFSAWTTEILIGYSGLVLSARVIERFLIRHDRIVEELLQRILSPDLEEESGQTGLFA